MKIINKVREQEKFWEIPCGTVFTSKDYPDQLIIKLEMPGAPGVKGANLETGRVMFVPDNCIVQSVDCELVHYE